MQKRPDFLPTVLFVNGSLGGEGGNAGIFSAKLKERFFGRAEVRELVLRDEIFSLGAEGFAKIEKQVAAAQGLVFVTGTYWDSWGSPLQRFLELATGSEASAAWLGKPAAVLVTMHSVGGKGILSRLQGVLNTFGCLIPPMCGVVYSLANQEALRQGLDAEFAADLWGPEDLEPLAHNLLTAIGTSAKWRAWPVDRADPARRWISD